MKPSCCAVANTASGFPPLTLGSERYADPPCIISALTPWLWALAMGLTDRPACVHRGPAGWLSGCGMLKRTTGQHGGEASPPADLAGV